MTKMPDVILTFFGVKTHKMFKLCEKYVVWEINIDSNILI